jgi:hypothetical protein
MGDLSYHDTDSKFRNACGVAYWQPKREYHVIWSDRMQILIGDFRFRRFIKHVLAPVHLLIITQIGLQWGRSFSTSNIKRDRKHLDLNHQLQSLLRYNHNHHNFTLQRIQLATHPSPYPTINMQFYNVLLALSFIAAVVAAPIADPEPVPAPEAEAAAEACNWQMPCWFFPINVLPSPQVSLMIDGLWVADPPFYILTSIIFSPRSSVRDARVAVWGFLWSILPGRVVFRRMRKS